MMAIDAFNWAVATPVNLDSNLNIVASGKSPIVKGVLTTHRPRVPRKNLKRVQVIYIIVIMVCLNLSLFHTANYK